MWFVEGGAKAVSGFVHGFTRAYRVYQGVSGAAPYFLCSRFGNEP